MKIIPIYNHSSYRNTEVSNTISFKAKDKETFFEDIFLNPPERTLEESTTDLKDKIKRYGEKKKRKDGRDILEYFGMAFVRVGNDYYSLSHYKQPSKDFTFKDLGIDENNFLAFVKEIEDDADFRRTSLHSTKGVRTIRGNCTVSGSGLERFPFLETIYGNLEAENSKMNSLGNLKTVTGNVNCAFSSLKNLGRLRYVGGNLDLTGNYSLQSLCCVKRVEGDIYMADTNIRNAKDLEYVGGNIYLTKDQAFLLIKHVPTEVLEKCVIVEDKNEE